MPEIVVERPISEYKQLGGHVTEAKEVNRDGIRLGIVEGYFNTWELDEGNDVVDRGAWANSLAVHRSRRDRQVRIMRQHRSLIGGAPISGVAEDSRGLFGSAEVNLDTALGADSYSFARQGVLVDFSVGFRVKRWTFNEDNDQRTIHEAELFEASLVDEPMNRGSNVTAVKQAAEFADLALAPAEHEWKPHAAALRVAELKFAQGDGRQAFLLPELQMQFADVVDGELKAVPQAVIQIASELQAETDLPVGLVAHVERYLAKMDHPSPFKGEAHEFFAADDVRDWNVRDYENALRQTGRFSKAALRVLSARYTGDRSSDAEVSRFVDQIRRATSALD